MKHARLIFLLVLLAVAPRLVYRWASANDKKYDELVSRHECREGPCTADFDGDGIAGRLIIEWRKDSIVAGDQWLIASDQGRELLRLPFWYADNTLRSHAAIRNDDGKSPLLIFWGGMREPKNSTSVYVWSGESMSEVTATAADREVLSAMEARDDAGGFADWVMFRVLRDAALAGYYILLLAAAVLVWIRLRRKLRSSAAEI
jgi:hypothetical protein